MYVYAFLYVCHVMHATLTRKSKTVAKSKPKLKSNALEMTIQFGADSEDENPIT